jgi:hypothetical protein
MLQRSIGFSLLIISICLTACTFKCSVGNTAEDQKGKKYKPVEKNGALVYNGIDLKPYHVSVSKAYLVNDDSVGELVDESNFIDVREGVKLLILIDSGWTETPKGVLLGASMTAVSDDGQELLKREDMFEQMGNISVEDSKIIGLSLYFNEWKARRPVTIKVNFKVWDKNSDAFVQGSYSVHTK